MAINAEVMEKQAGEEHKSYSIHGIDNKESTKLSSNRKFSTTSISPGCLRIYFKLSVGTPIMLVRNINDEQRHVIELN